VNSIPPPKIDSPPIVRTRTFISFGHWQLDTVESQHHWLALLDPYHLQVLRIPLTEDSCSFFLTNDHPSLCPFPSLHALDLDVHESSLPLLSKLLSKTPTLHSLELLPDYFDPEEYTRIVNQLESPAACPVPYLKKYRGPHKLLPVLLGQAMVSPSARLRRLFLESVHEAGDPLDAFINSFEWCNPLHLRGVTHIHISWLESMDLKSLANLRDMFPVLQEFYLHASEEYPRLGLSCEFSEIPCPFNATPPFFVLRG
jgi:hypothetical protein